MKRKNPWEAAEEALDENKKRLAYRRRNVKPLTDAQKLHRMNNPADFRVATISRSIRPRHPSMWARWLVVLAYQLQDHGLKATASHDLSDIVDSDEGTAVPLWLADGKNQVPLVELYSKLNYNNPRIKNTVMPLVEKTAELVGGDPQMIDDLTFNRIIDFWEHLMQNWSSFATAYLRKEEDFVFNPLYVAKATEALQKFYNAWIDIRHQDLHTRTRSGRGVSEQTQADEALPSGRGLSSKAEPTTDESIPSGRGMGHLFQPEADDDKE